SSSHGISYGVIYGVAVVVIAIKVVVFIGCLMKQKSKRIKGVYQQQDLVRK
ncbi:hypothetical protein KI387_005085, partial [Taxus chinensis]